jgi:hypothetical protein
MRFHFSICMGLCLALSACGSSAGNASAGGNANGGSGAGGGSSATGGTAGTSTGGAPAGCVDTGTATGRLTSQYGATEIPTTGGGKSYFLQTNWWHIFNGQSVNYSGLSFTIGDPNATTVDTTDNAPTGFPSLFIGSYSGHSTVGSNLPKQVSALTSVPTVFDTNALDLVNFDYNATYDVWFTQSSAPLPQSAFSPGTGGAYLMVWLYKPRNRQPRGGNGSFPNIQDQTVEGMPGTWDIWIDPARGTSPPCTSYVASTPVDSLTFDLNAFIKDAVTNNRGITNSMYLSLVFAGFEVWGGGDGLAINRFCATVN